MPNHHRHMHRGAEDAVLVDLEERAPEAVTRTVYKTLEPTFEGDIGGYTTVKSAVVKPSEVQKKESVTTPVKPPVSTPATKKPIETTTAQAKPKATSIDDADNTSSQGTKVTPKTTSVPDSTSMPTAINRLPTDSESIGSLLATASDEPTMTPALTRAIPTDVATSPAVASAAATSDAAAAAKSDDGSSAGTKAGIAFGVLGGLFVVGLLVFFLFNRRRKRAEGERQALDDEKLNGPIGGHHNAMAAETMSVRTNPNAPRVSLRPVTQFLPNWNLDKRASKDAGMALTPTAAAAAPAAMATTSRAPGGSAWDRPTTSASIDPVNPFGNQAERVPSPIQEESLHTKSMPVSPVSSNASPVSDPLTANGPPVVPGTTAAAAAVAVGAAAGAGAAVALTRKTSMRNHGPKNLDLTLPPPPLSTIPPSPAGTEFSMNSVAAGASAPQSAGAAAIAAAGGPPNSAVHRVQLDFKPTLEDELGLRAGDLVRLLHEYDDGWALVIRLDRSQQGVVPRTCLSTRPVKPRPAQGPRPGPPIKPNGPPRGPNSPAGQQRPMTPQGPPNQGRPASPARAMTPNGGRPMSPAGPRNGPPRAMSPAGPRSQSPGPRSQSPGPRSQSPSGMGRRPSPPGPSPMNPAQAPRPGPPTGPVGRKPVPGQAY